VLIELFVKRIPSNRSRISKFLLQGVNTMSVREQTCPFRMFLVLLGAWLGGNVGAVQAQEAISGIMAS
jgi:hypothetical protein